MAESGLAPGLRATYSEAALRGFRGFIKVPSDGLYTFVLRSDDGSPLSIGGKVVIDHGRPHGTEDKHGMIALGAGYHLIEVRYFQAGGGAELALLVQPGEAAAREVPASWLLHAR